MQRNNPIREKVSVEQESKQEAVEETPELRPTVELQTQAKIDSDVRDAIAAAGEQDYPHGMTLEAQEKWEAREAEKRRTRKRADREQTSRREELCREMTQAKHCGLSSKADPRKQLDVKTRREIKKQAIRLDGKCRGGLGVEAIERELAARFESGRSMQDAVLDMVEDVQAAPGAIVALGELEQVGRKWVDIKATVETLWEPSSPKMAQVGLLEDETGTTKFTSWVRSQVSVVAEGQRVRIRDAAMNWYQGRCSVAFVGRTNIEFPNRDDWW
jgi:hypothetical protein